MISETVNCDGHPVTSTMLGKQVFSVNSGPYNAHSGFVHKRLSSGPTFTSGTACAFSCRYCYVEAMVRKQAAVRKILRDAGRSFDQVVIRRNDPRGQLALVLTRPGGRNESGVRVEDILQPHVTERWGLTGKRSISSRAPRFIGEEFRGKVVFGSPLVDVAATPELARETVDLCEMFLLLTSYDLRLLSKSPNLASIVAKDLADRMPKETRERVIFGLSTGTLDDAVAAAIEPVPPPSKRLEALHWLQDTGFRTYGMLCPILPQVNPAAYAKAAMAAIRAEKCENVWAEPVNFRAGKAAKDDDEVAARNSFEATLRGLAKHKKEAERFQNVALDENAWEQYCRGLFEALLAAAPKRMNGQTKLIWMQYPRNFESIPHWLGFEANGAVLLGAIMSLYRAAPFVLKRAGINPAKLVEPLVSGAKPGAAYVLGMFPKNLRAELAVGAGAVPATEDACKAVIGGLNAIIKRPLKLDEGEQKSIYVADELQGVTLSAETRKLLARGLGLDAVECVRLNRLLLEDVFPEGITRMVG